jgi:hypothetical protein
MSDSSFPPPDPGGKWAVSWICGNRISFAAPVHPTSVWWSGTSREVPFQHCGKYIDSCTSDVHVAGGIALRNGPLPHAHRAALGFVVFVASPTIVRRPSGNRWTRAVVFTGLR